MTTRERIHRAQPLIPRPPPSDRTQLELWDGVDTIRYCYGERQAAQIARVAMEALREAARALPPMPNWKARRAYQPDDD
jgi:hypothetical protein